MNAFRALLVGMTLALVAYTAIALSHDGWNLFAIFFADVAKAKWAGQFDLDFLCYLLLSGSWIAWRHRFTPAGIGLGLLGAIGGTLVFAPYLLVESLRAKGDLAPAWRTRRIARECARSVDEKSKWGQTGAAVLHQGIQG